MMRPSVVTACGTFLGFLVVCNPAQAAPPDTIHVFKYDGTAQCGMGKEVSLDEMAKQLQALGVAIVSKEKRKVPLKIIALCGAPTGQANIYEISTADLKKATATDEKAKFTLWFFDYEIVSVYKYDGTLRCGMGQWVTLDEMEKELTTNGIVPISKTKASDGLMHLACCGCSTGQINVYDIKSSDYPKASSLGFQFRQGVKAPGRIESMSLHLGGRPKANEPYPPWPW